ncbi:MAG TPA: MiaB/RimO family radical SAM methylthiotransferase [Polyangiaceae bacterium]|nr:MiaB/RimO family radical SAM methylthiotransferase [Polyangiaceae bacterium]
MQHFAIVTFGCQMNQHDSDRIAEVLRGAGMSEVREPEAADFVLLNTCSVREKAEQKLRSEVGRLGVLKRARPGLVIGVAGCVAQQEGERLLKKLPQIDLMIGPDNIPELPALLADCEAGGPPRVRTEFDVDAPSFLAHSVAHAPAGRSPSAFVTVMKGCNERCSFCIVPYTRGPERYRPAREILAEIAELTQAGVREVTLLGQTVNSYSDPAALFTTAGTIRVGDEATGHWQHTERERARADESEFPELLRAIASHAPNLLRLRYTSPHPRHLTRSLIRAHSELDVLSRHVHMPVQSGSDRMLKRMIRRYTVAEYLERVTALKAAVPGLTLSTDIIVGFPGESRSDFEQTLELVQQAGFVGVFAFKYSPRPFTPALKLGDDVPEREKSARLSALFELANAQRQHYLKSLEGAEVSVLVEGRGKAGHWGGRSERNEIVHFAASHELLGRLVRVRVVSANKNSLLGEFTDTIDGLSVDTAVADAARLLPQEPALAEKPLRRLPLSPL